MPEIVVKFTGDTSALTAAISAAKSALADVQSSVDKLNGSFDNVSDSMNDARDAANQAGSQMATAQGHFANFADRMAQVHHSFEGLKTIGSTLSNVSSSVGGVIGAVESALAKMGIAAGIVVSATTAAVASISAMSVEAAHYGESIRVAAGSADQSVETMSRIKAVADRAGIGLDDIGKSFENLQKKAKQGDGDVKAALQAIGVSVHDAATLSQDALAVRMADAFSKAEESSNKAAAASKLFGDAATKLLPQLDQGADRLIDLYAAATRAGVVIGPDLSAKLQGTEGLIQTFRDRMSELKETFQGGTLQSFVQFKAAIDGLIRLFSDVLGNVASLVQSFNNLDGAGQRSGQTIGLLGRTATGLAGAIIQASTFVEEFGVRFGAALLGVYKVEGAVFSDIAKGASIASNAIYTTFTQAIRGVILSFGDLASAVRSAFSFDRAGISAAYAQLGTDVSSVGAKIRQAFSPGFSGSAAEAWKEVHDGAAASARSVDSVIAKLEAQKQAQLALVAAGGAKGGPVSQTQSVGNPNAPKDGDNGGTSDAQLVSAAFKTAEGEVEAAKQAEERKKQLADAGVELHQTTEDEKTAATKTATDAQYAAELSAWNKVAKLKNLTVSQQQEVADKIRAINEEQQTETLRLQIQAAEATQRTWDEVTDRISGAFQGQVDGILAGTTRIGQAFKNVMQQMLGEAVKFCIGWSFRHAETIAENILGINAEVTHQLAGETAKTTATEAGAAARAGSEIAGLAASGAATIASLGRTIAADAGAAFAGVTAFLSPVMGPAAVGPAAATEATVIAAGASIPSLAVGAYDVPSDTLAFLHQGEMVVPSTPAQTFRDAMSGTGGAGDMHLHVNLPESAIAGKNGTGAEAGVAARVSNEVVGVANSAGAMLATVGKSIATYLSPVIGPAAGLPAAAAPSSLAVGNYGLPPDTLTLLHQPHEMAGPASTSQTLRDAMAGTSSGGSSSSTTNLGGLGGVHIYPQADHSADAIWRGFMSKISKPNHQRELARALATTPR